MNAFEQIGYIRDMLGEATAAHWSDRELLSHLNNEQNRLAMILGMKNANWFTTSVAVTPVASVITLPVDCAKPVYLEETTQKVPIDISINVSQRMLSRQPTASYYEAGSKDAYLLSGQIVVNQESYTTACTLWYRFRPQNLHVGTAGAGGVASITLSAHDGVDVASGGFGAKQIADYYNGVSIQVVEGTGAGAPDTITDYTSGRVATVTGTYGATSDYGTISRLPEEAHLVMCSGAALLALAKPSSAIDPKYFEYLRERHTAYIKVFQDWVSTDFIGSKRTRITEID